MRSPGWAPLLLVLGIGFAVVPALAGQPRPPVGWESVLAAGRPVAVTVEPVEITGGALTGLALRGAWVLRSRNREFGGFSGLVVSGGRLFAVSDKGRFLGAALRQLGGVLRLENARMAAMRGGDGRRYRKAGGDAEGLTLDGGRLAVSFERDHRVMRLGGDGRMGETVQPGRFGQFRYNKGLEALATLPDGRLIALAEGTDDGGVPVFLIDSSGSVREARLAPAGRHSVTGADVGPDGRLYLVLRDYSALSGVSIRVMRYRLGPDGLPLAGGETLAAFEAGGGIDNMEGISLDRGADGKTRLWLISDDNFRSSQRTLLMLFEVLM